MSQIASALKDDDNYYYRVFLQKALKNAINSILFPQWNKEHNITIKAKTSNPLKEHSIDILNRLPQNQQIGRKDTSLNGGHVQYQIKSDLPFN